MENLCFSTSIAKELIERVEKVILVCSDTTAGDREIIKKLKKGGGGLVTREGRISSHASIITSSGGIPCVSCASNIQIASDKKSCMINDKQISEYDIISIDGTTCCIYNGEVKVETYNFDADFDKVTPLKRFVEEASIANCTVFEDKHLFYAEKIMQEK